MPSRRQRRQTEPMYLATAVSLDAAPLGRAASVVGDGGDVPDGLDLHPRGLQGPDGRLPAASRPLDANVEGAQPALLGRGGGRGGRLLGGEGRPLARPRAPRVSSPSSPSSRRRLLSFSTPHPIPPHGGGGERCCIFGSASSAKLLGSSSRGSWPAAAPCGCGRSCACAGPAPAGCAGGASPGRSRSP